MLRSAGTVDGPAIQFTRARKGALLIAVLLYVAGIVVAASFVDERTLRSTLGLPLGIVLALLGLSLVNYVVRGWRWLVLSRHLELGVPARANLLYYFAGYCFTATPGKAGEAVRLWFLRFGHAVPYGRSLPLMVADRILDTWAVLIISVASIAGFAQYRWHGLALVGLIGLASIPVVFPRRFEPVLTSLHGVVPGHGRLFVKLRRVVRVMADLSHWRTYGLTLGPTVIGWLAESAALYVLLRHFGADIGFANAVFIFSFSMIVGAVSMLPGGLGSTEATMVILLKALGVELGVALAATAIVRVTTFWFAVAIGMLLMPPAMNAATAARRATPA
jgi:uncharacterized protein (TIRG00374 family)